MFAQHGNYTLYSEHNIIIFRAVGAWNIEATRNATSKIKAIVDAIPTETHAFIFDTHQVEGMTPDSYIEWTNAVNYWLSRGFKALVRIDDAESANYKLFIQGFDVYLRELIPFTFADNIQGALNWVHQLGFKGFENGLNVIGQTSDYES